MRVNGVAPTMTFPLQQTCTLRICSLLIFFNICDGNVKWWVQCLKHPCELNLSLAMSSCEGKGSVLLLPSLLLEQSNKTSLKEQGTFLMNNPLFDIKRISEC